MHKIFYLYKENTKIPKDVKECKNIISISISENNYPLLIFNEKGLVIDKLPCFIILRNNIRIKYPIEKMDEVLNYARNINKNDF